jgi:uncharacterized damage-inducible protein DinB
VLEEILELYEYDRWANSRILQAAAALTPEEFTRDLASSFPSVRDTLAHILGAEWLWLQRWLGSSPAALPSDWDIATAAALSEKWREIEGEQQKFLSTLSGDSLATEVSYRNTAGKAYTSTMRQMLHHVINHSTYHRGQITTMLRQLGSVPPATDLIVFYRERAGSD